MVKLTIQPEEKDLFVNGVSTLLEVPINNLEGFTRRSRCLESINKFKNDGVFLEFETDDFKFLFTQFEWGLQNRQLVGNEGWSKIGKELDRCIKELK